MRWKIIAVSAFLFLFQQTAFAHRIDEYLQATLLSIQANRVQASIRLIPGILVAPSVIATIDTNQDGIFSESEKRAYAQRVLGDLFITINGRSLQPDLVSWDVPQPAEMRSGLGEIHIEYTLDLPNGSNRVLTLSNHHLNPRSVYLVNAVVPEDRGLRILAQKRNDTQSMYELVYEQARPSGAPSQGLWTSLQLRLRSLSFSSLFHLGMRHIAEGTDHLLFLLTLLLPAPLLVSRSRWGPLASVRQSLVRIVGIVTAFTLGHSITLILAALGAVHVPSRPVEVLIAFSIFISAIHALRPLFPGKEAWIAAGFGLIHGLAFAATLTRLGLGLWERVTGILAFNLGIETMQMLIVAIIVPSLLLISRTPAYSMFRICGAAFAGAASLAWMTERVLNVETPADMIVNALARHALSLGIALFLLSLACRLLIYPRAQAALL